MKTKIALAATAICAIAASASAQNPAHAPRDLVLTFQNPGGATGSDQAVTAAIGLSSTFRDAAPGSFTLIGTVPQLNSVLTNTFGAGWYDASTLWVGAVSNTGSLDSQGLTAGDVQRTLYFTRARNSVGVVGEVNSAGFTFANNSTFSAATSGIASIKTALEANSTTSTLVQGTGPSPINDQNPFTSPGNQGAAYGGIIVGGTQDNFDAGSFGLFGDAGNVEIALDLYRSQPYNGIAGQARNDRPVGVGDFLGTITINDAGAVGFTAATVIPEPSTALLGFAALGFAGMIRRRKPVQS